MVAKLSSMHPFISYGFISELALIILAVLFLLGAIYALLISIRMKKFKAEHQELLLYGNFMRTLAQTEKSLVYIKDENLRYLFVNPAVEKFYRMTGDAIIGRNDADISEPEFAEIKTNTDCYVLENRKAKFSEIRWQQRIYEANKFPVLLPSGKIGVGALISDITEKYLNQIKLEQTSFRNEILSSSLLRNYPSVQEQLDYVLNETVKLTKSEYGYIYLYNEETQQFTLNSWSKGVIPDCDLSKSNKDSKLSTVGLWGEVVRQSRPIIINDYANYQFNKKGYPQGHVRLKNYMSVPIIIEEKIIATVGLANKPYDYDETDVKDVTILMNGIWHNIERRKRTIELEAAIGQLKANKAQLELILNSTADAIFGINREGKCTFYNKSFNRLMGYKNDNEIIGKDMHRILRHSHKPGVLVASKDCKIRKAYIEGCHVHIDNEIFYRADGNWFYAEYNSYPQYQDGEIVGAVVSFGDITERKKAEEEMVKASFCDALTGLYNRRFFNIEIQRIDKSVNLPISIIMGDANGLKLINDVFGHAEGDKLLSKAAQILKNCCRDNDIIARWGGDEFVVILPHCSESAVKKIADNIQNAFGREKVKDFVLSISLGYATKKEPEQSIIEIVNTAEEQMYIEKSLNERTFHYSAIVNILNGLFEKNPEVRRHSERVSYLSERLGRRLCLSESELKRLVDAGYYHDIGKISSLDEVQAEYRDYKKHPVIGFRILNNSADTVAIAKYVLSHHERWDGTGYPNGLKGEAIPRISRIIRITEYYDYLRNVIKEPLSKDKALACIAEKAGTLFDPNFVEEFIVMIKNDKEP